MSMLRKYLSLMLYFPDGTKDIEYGTTFWHSKFQIIQTLTYQKNEVQDFKLNSENFKNKFIPNCLYGFLRNDFPGIALNL